MSNLCLGHKMTDRREKLRNKRQMIVARIARGRILDIGFADNPNKYLKGEVVGLDLKKVELPKNYSKEIVADFNHLKLRIDKRFDTVTALEFIEHIENPVAFFKKCNEFLKKGGLLIVSTPTPYYYKTLVGNLFFPRGYSRIEKHIHIFAPRILNNVAKHNGFEVVDVKNATSRLPLINWQLIYVYRKK